MYVCMVTHVARVWINLVRKTGEKNISLSAFAPEIDVSKFCKVNFLQ